MKSAKRSAIAFLVIFLYCLLLYVSKCVSKITVLQIIPLWCHKNGLIYFSKFSSLLSSLPFFFYKFSSHPLLFLWKFDRDSSWHRWADEHHRLAGEQRGKLLQRPHHSDIPSGTLVPEVDPSSSKPSRLWMCQMNPSGFLWCGTLFNSVYFVNLIIKTNKGRIECNSLDSDNGLSLGKTDCTIDRPIFRSNTKVGQLVVLFHR